MVSHFLASNMSPSEVPAKQFAVNWNNHMNHVRRAFDSLLNNCELTDVILYAEGQKIGAHKMLLSACSTYFRNLFREFPQDHPIVVLKGVSYTVLTDILKFIYNGEVSVDSEVFDGFLQTAEFLQISGLTDDSKTEDTKQKRPHFEQNKEVSKTKKLRKTRSESNSNTVKKIEENHLEEDNENVDIQGGILSAILNDDTSHNGTQFSPEAILETVETNGFSEEVKVKIEIDQPDEQYNRSETSSPDNPLKCPICSKVFSHPYSLHHHKPVHLGGTKCPICHVVLSRKYNLKMHMRSRHNVVC